MSTDTAPAPPDASEATPDLARITSAAVHRLQGQVTQDNAGRSGGGRALVATLRNAAGYAPADHIRAWTLMLEEVLADFPERWLRSDEPSREEWAAFTAMTHWALHQQSLSRPMHVSGRSRHENVGYAVGQLARRRDSASIKSRFDALLLNPGESAVRHHLRSMVQLLRAEEIPTDYGRLAEDLADLKRRGGRRRVALRWGRGYARGTFATSDDGDSTDS